MTVSRPELLVNGSDAEFRTLIHRLMSFSRCINAIRDGFGSLAGISGVQYEILMWVGRLQGADGITVGEVSTAMRQSGAFTTIETGKLVEKGLLEKSADLKDRRRVRLRITDAGRDLLSSLVVYQRRVNDTLFGSIKADELGELSGTLRELLPCADQAANLMQFILKQGSADAAIQ
ncbi:MAG TPA: MarR family transcriptional regulator [Candidatus Binataceae bacterium]|nr:MarR family transcriptional regulator [Candidatus Binataceae bacterium]